LPCFLITTFAVYTRAADAAHPNIIYILADDLGYAMSLPGIPTAGFRRRIWIGCIKRYAVRNAPRSDFALHADAP